MEVVWCEMLDLRRGEGEDERRIRGILKGVNWNVKHNSRTRFTHKTTQSISIPHAERPFIRK